MKIDIVGSKFTRKLTEFKNFRFEVNQIVEGQSILSLLSDPYAATMKELNTTDLNDITVAYRDLNKILYPNLQQTDAEIILVDLLSELNSISKIGSSYYNTSSLELLNERPQSQELTNIEKFRILQSHINPFTKLLQQYDKVIFLKLLPKDEKEAEFIEGLYQLLERNVEHKLLLSIDNTDFNENLEAPLEVYDNVNNDLRNYSSEKYHNQLLFDESLDEDLLWVYVNYVEKREYLYELYKDGKPFKQSAPTTSRYYEFKLDEPGKYRIRVNLTNNEINPRFSQTYEFDTQDKASEIPKGWKYIELPSKNNLWMLDILLEYSDISGFVGNAYQFPNGYMGHLVFFPEEIKYEYLPKEELFDTVINIISNMNADEFKYFMDQNKHIKSKNPFIYNFLVYVQRKKE